MLLFCLASPVLISYSWYTLQKKVIRKEIKRKIISGMHREELILLTFTSKLALKSLRWEHDGEFEYKNQMYDIVERETSGDTLRYWCYSDTEETKLNSMIKELAANSMGQNPQNRESQKRLLTFLQTLWLPDQFTWDPGDSNRDHELFRNKQFLYTSILQEPLVPPPRIS